MSIGYKINYSSMIEALKMGGVEGAQAFKSARGSRGLATPLETEKYVADKEEKPSLQKRILGRMNDVQKQNKSMLEQ